MKRARMKIVSVLMFSILFVAPQCSKQAKEKKYDTWLESLNDSIALIERQVEADNASIDSLRADVDRLLPDFEYISNAREVEGYTIYKGWARRYPLTTTGLVARMSENTALELVATYVGGNFNRIAVVSGGERVESAEVPYDQALNYREGGRNTVAFTGHAADSVAQFVDAHLADKITVEYTGEGRTYTSVLAPDAARMIAATWQLVDAFHTVKVLEHKVKISEEKIRLMRMRIDNNKPADAARDESVNE